MRAPAVSRSSLVCALAAAGLTVVACSGASGPTGPESGPAPVSAGPPPAGTPLFAFKAGLDQAEQIWLWLEGDGLHPVSTWAPDDPVTTVNRRPTYGYNESLGRFGPLRFDHQRRFLLTSERVVDAARPRPRMLPSRRFVSYELATGNLVTSKPLTDWTPEFLVTPTSTLLVAPVPGRSPGKPWLYAVVDGKLVPAPGAAEIVAPDSPPAYAADVGGEPVLAVGRLVVQRTQGMWHTIAGLDTSSYWTLVGSPRHDAACIIGREPGEPPPTVSFLLTAEEGLRRLPCEGVARSCTFSPTGERLYLDGCANPVIGRDLQTRAAASVRLQGGANIRMGEGWRTLGAVEVPGVGEGTRPIITAFDWQTLEAAPLPPEGSQMLPDNCGVIAIDAPANGTGIAVVRTHCGCFNCYDGSAYAVDLAAQKLYLIHDRGEALTYGAALLGRAAVTTMTGTMVLPKGTEGVPMLYWSDASGTRMVGPLPGVQGILHNPIVF